MTLAGRPRKSARSAEPARAATFGILGARCQIRALAVRNLGHKVFAARKRHRCMLTQMKSIVLRGARTHNLQRVDLDLSPGQLVVVTGPSGSGKSSLAIDTLYAEGQRRFIESFSPYARQFLERLERPPMDRLDPVAAGVAVDRRAAPKSSRSTVSTLADLEPYLAALFYREARPVCPKDGNLAEWFDAKTAVGRLLDAFASAPVTVTYPERVGSVEGYLDVRERLMHMGYQRIWLNGRIRTIDEITPSEVLTSGTSVRVIVDRLKAEKKSSHRLMASIEQAWSIGAGACEIMVNDQAIPIERGLCCPACGHHFAVPPLGTFSSQSPLGACGSCRGFGRTLGIDLNRVIPDHALSLKAGAVRPWRGSSTTWERAELAKLCRRHGIDMHRPYAKLTPAEQRLVLDGDGRWEDDRFPGVIGWFRWLETRTYKMHVRVLLSRYRSYDVCASCSGRRLNEQALAYSIDGRNLADFASLEIHEATRITESTATRSAQGELARRELLSRLRYLDRVGLGYLRLDRQARTLSGGEAQRVTLTAALGTSLSHALFVLDEPTVGLHPSDIPALLTMVRELADRENVVVIVEHDAQVIAAADRVIELGPGAGNDGGQIVADGTPQELYHAAGATARALRSAKSERRVVRTPSRFLVVQGARANNLRDIEVRIPLDVLCVVTGPSGSGKSTLVVDIVARAIARQSGRVDEELPLEHQGILGAEVLRDVVVVDQSPLGRTSRGNAATYTKAWDTIRKLFAAEPAAQHKHLTASSFSFNVAGGRCEACAGEGAETVEMQFLADVRLSCPECGGRRFRPEVCAVRHRGLSIAELLETTIDATLELFSDQTALIRALGPLRSLGLGYLRLGQPLSTLSGGEAQRLKLARALGESKSGTLLVLDEPSAGLHVDEVGLVLSVLNQLVTLGCSVIVVEHDLDVVRASDWVIDLGPGAGAAGGTVVGSGPVAVIERLDSKTAVALRSRPHLAKDPIRHGSANGDNRALVVERAREHNLREISCEIPHGQMTVVTGPSGSGKSTLAFDVVFAEGQRRFFETLTPYARQFLPTMPRPNVDAVRGVPPMIALEQRTTRADSSSTVATVTEVAQYLRLLYARVGLPHCPVHGLPIRALGPDALKQVLTQQKKRFVLLAPAVRGRKGTYLDLFAQAARAGIAQAYVDGRLALTDQPPRLARGKEHDIDLVIATNVGKQGVPEATLATALHFGNDEVRLRFADATSVLLSTRSACPTCGVSVGTLDPRWFSFNTRQGRCATCEGSGTVTQWVRRSGKREELASLCSDCGGTKLSAVARHVRVSGLTYPKLLSHSIRHAKKSIAGLEFSTRERSIAVPIIGEIVRRLDFLDQVGLGYLTLDRAAPSLSGGELQRLRLGAQLGAGLTGALYVLDEPTIGLHPRDTQRLLGNLRKLVELGSTVLVVEHDIDTIRAADHLIDLGPGGGTHGGTIVASGAPSDVIACKESPTGRALAKIPEMRQPIPIPRRHPMLVLEGAREHNLRGDPLRVPLERMTVVAGVSGSGKSTLVRRVLLPAVQAALGLASEPAGIHSRLQGWQALRRALSVDQSPIGRTPRSVPATFLGIWDPIRRLFAATNEAKMQGHSASRFSFNTASGGRCSTCDGQGVTTEAMSFLPDVITPCSACGGARFEPRTLEVRYLGLNIAEVLELTAEQAAALFENHPAIAAPLRTLVDLGAGYIHLGQGSHTLSGGEAQRLKLAVELTAGARHEPTLYVLDEPTTGLHLGDVERLVRVFSRLVARGDTLVVIEHHPHVIADADHVVELGPEAGELGGRIIAEGPPSSLVERRTTTGRVIADLLKPKHYQSGRKASRSLRDATAE
jgi:excinuclease ABC subunit A